ncbi:MAG: hypothetical protein ABH827_01265 [bacterium]
MFVLKRIKFAGILFVLGFIFCVSSLWATKEAVISLDKSVVQKDVVQPVSEPQLLSKTPTLFELSRKCFDELPEKTDKYKTILSADELKKNA